MPTTSITLERKPTPTWVRIFAWATFLVVLVLIFYGGMVKSTNAGLSVPDWPNTYGHFMFSFPLDRMIGGVYWEHTHRMIASVAGALTVVLAIIIFVLDKRRWLKNLAVATVVLVIIQGVLGGVTVLQGLPVLVSTLHGTIAQIYFSMVLVMALALSPAWGRLTAERPNSDIIPVKKLAYTLVGAILIQLVVGAVMRHMEAGLVIPDFPTMFGSWTPPLSDEAIAKANIELEQYQDRDGILMPTTVERHHMIVHLLHRTWAFVVLAIGLLLAFRILKRLKESNRLRRSALYLILLLCSQVSLGILTIYTTKNETITTFHVLFGAVLLALSVSIATTLTRLARLSSAAGHMAVPMDAPVESIRRQPIGGETA